MGSSADAPSRTVPSAVSTRIIPPGASRPRCATAEGSSGSAPASEHATTRPSWVRSHRRGRRPLRSSRAPTETPSVKHTAAGPSQGSMRSAIHA
jgi:hypothetical protein